MEDQHLRGVAGGDREARGAAFERRDPLLQHGVGRVADAGVDVAERLQPEQRGGVIDVVEHERRGLIDRRCARAGGRVGLRAGMDRERGKAGNAFGHERYPVSDILDEFDRGQKRGSCWFIEPQGGVKAKAGGCVNSQPPCLTRLVNVEWPSPPTTEAGRQISVAVVDALAPGRRCVDLGVGIALHHGAGTASRCD